MPSFTNRLALVAREMTFLTDDPNAPPTAEAWDHWTEAAELHWHCASEGVALKMAELAHDIAQEATYADVHVASLYEQLGYTLGMIACGTLTPAEAWLGLRGLTAEVASRFVLRPISGLSLSVDEVPIGDVTIYRSLRHAIRATGVDATEEQIANDARPSSFRMVAPGQYRMMQGGRLKFGAVAAVKAVGDVVMSSERAANRIDLELDVIRCFALANRDLRRRHKMQAGGVRIEIGLRNPTPSRAADISTAQVIGGVRAQVGVIGRPDTVLDVVWGKNTVAQLPEPLQGAWRACATLLASDQTKSGPLSPGSQRLLSAVHWIARANESWRAVDIMLHSVVAIEAIATFEQGTGVGDIKDRIAERAAYLLSDESTERLEIYERVRAAYDARSGTVHGRPEAVPLDVALRMRVLALDLLGAYVGGGLHELDRKGLKAWVNRHRFGTIEGK